jgi:hypothetical protein
MERKVTSPPSPLSPSDPPPANYLDKTSAYGPLHTTWPPDWPLCISRRRQSPRKSTDPGRPCPRPAGQPFWGDPALRRPPAMASRQKVTLAATRVVTLSPHGRPDVGAPWPRAAANGTPSPPLGRSHSPDTVFVGNHFPPRAAGGREKRKTAPPRAGAAAGDPVPDLHCPRQ